VLSWNGSVGELETAAERHPFRVYAKTLTH
jgi:hypothetical protein